MKKLTLIIGILVAANILYAQNERDNRRAKSKVKIEEYKDRLNLTEDQLTELKKLREEMKPELEALKKDPSLTRPDRMRAHADLLDERKAEVEKILNDQQVAELEEIREEERKRRLERMERRKERREGREDRGNY